LFSVNNHTLLSNEFTTKKHKNILIYYIDIKIDNKYLMKNLALVFSLQIVEG